jgi:hypothetical protein
MIATHQNTELQMTDALPRYFANRLQFDDEMRDDSSL